MTIQIGKHNFEGPFSNTGDTHARSGVYVILGRSNGNHWSVVDIGESASVRERLTNHDRKPCWRGRGHQELTAAVLYVAEQQRMLIESELRTTYNPPCGER